MRLGAGSRSKSMSEVVLRFDHSRITIRLEQEEWLLTIGENRRYLCSGPAGERLRNAA